MDPTTEGSLCNPPVQPGWRDRTAPLRPIALGGNLRVEQVLTPRQIRHYVMGFNDDDDSLIDNRRAVRDNGLCFSSVVRHCS